MQLPTKSLERNLFRQGYKKIIAVDEVGMGSLAGPVVVCAVEFNKRFFNGRHKNLNWLRESKLLAPHQRTKFVNELLKEKNFAFRISYCFPKTIDRINIYQAARLAMRRSIIKLAPPRLKTFTRDKLRKISRYFNTINSSFLSTLQTETFQNPKSKEIEAFINHFIFSSIYLI